jgi:hypothetical protein
MDEIRLIFGHPDKETYTNKKINCSSIMSEF